MANPNPVPPPKETRWKPGQSGNPKGKPKGTKHISTWIQDMLTDPDFELKLKDGTLLKQAPLEAIIKTAVAKSVSGDNRWAEWLAKHGYGEKYQIHNTGEIVHKYEDMTDEQLEAAIKARKNNIT